MATRIWTSTIKREMFKLLPKIEVNGKKVGLFHRGWTMKPPHFTVAEWNEACSLLTSKLLAKGLFPSPPRSDRAIDMQIQHCIAPQNNPQYAEMRQSTRFLAFNSGFLQMKDIMWLEEEAERKHGIRSQIERRQTTEDVV